MIPWRRVMTVRAVVLRLWGVVWPSRAECIVNTYRVRIFISKTPHEGGPGRETRRAAEPSVDGAHVGPRDRLVD
jgi:hypothetical protein